MARRDPHAWSIVRLPERDLSEVVLELAAPLLDRLGPAPSVDDARAAVALAISFWNASVLASKLWTIPRPKELNELKRQLCGPTASREDVATFDELSKRWSEHRFDPRLVDDWTYSLDGAGVARLVCSMRLPERVRAELPPPVQKRVALGGKYLDEVNVAQGVNISVSFPADRHRGEVGADGTATVYAMMATALQLFAEGRLTRVGGDPVEVAVGGRRLGPMVLTHVRCSGLNYDIAVLVFRPAELEASREARG